MSKFKRFIASVGAVCIAASMFASVSFASVPSDVLGTEFEDEAKVLGALEIMVGDAGTGSFRPEDPIIRSEVTKVGVALMGLTDVAESSKHQTTYPDVSTEHWANGFINTATSQKLVIGDDTGTFRPDDQIKYSEAVAILVRALGYEPQANAKGGYPSGYISTGISIGLTKGVEGSADKLIARGDVAKLAFNALTIKLMEQVGFGDKVSYEITDKTLLTDKLDAELVTGKVTAVGSSVIGDEIAPAKDEIRIGDRVFKVGTTDVRNVLGFTVDAYVSTKGSKVQTLLAAIPSEGKNKVLTVASDNIDKIEKTQSGTEFYYFDDDDTSDKSIKVAVSSDAQIIYNGKSASSDRFVPIESGTVILLDSDGNGKYDVVFVNETVNYVVDEIYTSTHKITDKYGKGTLELDTESEDKTVILERGNERIAVKDLKKWDVLTVTESEDKELIYATAVHKSIAGKVSEKSDDAIFIDGIKYKVASNFPDTFSLGTEGTFYLDYEGKIAAFDGKTQKSSNYAYMEKAVLTTGMDRALSLKIFTKDGEMKVLNAADKIKVNSQSGLTPEKALEVLGEEQKLITFETNSKGLVTQINTYVSSSQIDEDRFVLNLSEEGVVYRGSSSKLVGSDMSVTVGDSTLIFDIPAEGSENDYAVRDKKIFKDGGLYDVMVFDVTEDYKAGVVIVTNSQAKADEEAPISVVKSITTTKNEDGDTVYKIYALCEGKEISVTSADSKVFEKAEGKLLAEGDIIQYSVNSRGEAESIRVLFDASQKEQEFKTEHSEKLIAVYGKVIKKFSDSVNVQVGEGKAENYASDKAVIYVYDSSSSRNKLKVGDASDLQTYDNDGTRVFIRVYDDEVKEIVVIK